MGWHQLKMMFEGEDRQTVQSLTNNGTITPEHQKMPCNSFDAISTTIKAKEHFWHFWDVCQHPNEGIHALSTCICTLITQCKLAHPRPRKCLQSWSCNMQCNTIGPETGSGSRTMSQLTYQSLLAQCKLLKSQCEQYQKAMERGPADLTTLTAVTTSASSIHTNTLPTYHPLP